MSDTPDEPTPSRPWRAIDISPEYRGRDRIYYQCPVCLDEGWKTRGFPSKPVAVVVLVPNRVRRPESPRDLEI